MESILAEALRTDLPWLVVAGAGVVVLVCGLVMVLRVRLRARRRTRTLRRVFGPEYGHVLAVHRSRERAEAALAERVRRRGDVWLRDLDPPEREQAEAAWSAVVALFVESPAGGLHQADVVVSEVMRGRGYPVERFEDGASMISLDHPDLAQYLRAAHRVAVWADAGELADTEQMRQALVVYRHVLDALLGHQDVLAAGAE
jgi:hypothetical protein